MQRTVESECSVDFSHKHDPKLKGVDDVPNLGMITRLHMAVAQLHSVQISSFFYHSDFT